MKQQTICLLAARTQLSPLANRKVLRAILYLLLGISTAGAKGSGTISTPANPYYKGVHYQLVSETETYTWSEAQTRCPSGVLWVQDEAEMLWVTRTFGEDEDLWTAAGNSATEWPNGVAFSSVVPALDPSKPCLKVDVNHPVLKWEKCDDSKKFHVICKPYKTTTSTATSPTSSPTSSSSWHHSGSVIKSLSEPNEIQCARNCIQNSSCRSFEFKAAFRRCALLSELVPGAWVRREGAAVFTIGV